MSRDQCAEPFPVPILIQNFIGNDLKDHASAQDHADAVLSVDPGTALNFYGIALIAEFRVTLFLSTSKVWGPINPSWISLSRT